MNRWIALAVLIAGVIPLHAAQNVSLKKLEQELTRLQGKPDKAVARRLSGMELTERLTTARLVALQKTLPGLESRAALLALADASAFLKLPASEQLQKPAPGAAAQQAMLQSAAQYVAQTLSKLPNFFATQKIVHLEDSPAFHAGGVFLEHEPLHAVATAQAVVLYRDGRQVVDWGAGKSGKSAPPILGLLTSGEFGPILRTVLTDAAQGKIEWSHWETGDPDDVAVFAFDVPRARSHYEVKFCCIQSDTASVFDQFSGYHGEIALDPAGGTILRITMVADLKPANPVSRANLFVEYAPVDIGNRSYICPRRSVAEVQVYQQTAPQSPDTPPNLLGLHSMGTTSSAPGPLQTLLNDVSYVDYHLFRSDSRMLDSGTPVQQE